MQVHVLKHIEDNPNVRLLCSQKGCHRLNRNLSGLFIGKMKFPGGNTAKSNAPAVVFHGQFQAGTVTGGQGLTILFADRPIDNRPHSMQDVFAGQIEGRRDLCLS